MAATKEYLNHIEDAPDFPETFQKIAQEASEEAVSEAKEHGVSITYLKGGKIIREDPDGTKTVVVEEVESGKRVTVGQTTTI